MSIHSTTPPFDDDESKPLATATLGRLFADARRRTLLRVLASDEDAVELDRLTERVLDAEGTGAYGAGDERYDRVLLSLYRCHLPVLDDADLVDVREDDGVFVDPDGSALRQLV
ncbi:DUF7344 domain-containing protein [Halomarina rubra]|uniref:DUF7344 domain-containing protein n=1 Tax=Halomarina rubra TaxID=2071873 RepID=A0ABD6AWH2_9EURY|nr:hypothetical protein [Halomarina rubra]